MAIAPQVWTRSGSFRARSRSGPRSACYSIWPTYTTQRRADLPRLGRQFLRKDRYGNDRLEYVQHKLRNKKPVTAFVPIFPELQSSLDAAQASGILGEMLFLVQQRHPGQPDKP